MESRLNRRSLLAMLGFAPLAPALRPLAAPPAATILTTATLDAAMAKVRLMMLGDIIWSGVVIREQPMDIARG